MNHAYHHNGRFSLQHIQQAFSHHAGEYDTHAQLQQGVLFNALRELEPRFARDMSLLDAGCGTGYLLELLRYCEVPFEVNSCDIAPGMCLAARQRFSEDHPHNVACASITALPYADAAFDMAVSSLTFQWVDKPGRALREIYRVLKPGGHAVITSFGPLTLRELRDAFATVDDLPHVSSFPPLADLQQQAQEAGFTIANASTEFRTQHYASVRDLMHAIRAIGAANKMEGRRKSLTGRKRFTAMETAYREACETLRGIPATWEIHYLTLKKG